MTKVEIPRPPLDAGAVQRLWEYRAVVESTFHHRNSFLLVAESMVLVAFVGVLHLEGVEPWIPRVIAGFGLLLTLAWWYINRRHYANYLDTRRDIEEVCPEYRWIRSRRHRRGPSTWTIVANGVPLLTALMWVLLLANVVR